MQYLNDNYSRIREGYEDGEYTIGLPNGTYRLYHFPYRAWLINTSEPNYNTIYDAILSWDIYTTDDGGSGDSGVENELGNYSVGGLRVKSIGSFDEEGLVLGMKSYNYNLPTNLQTGIESSSGELFSYPMYINGYYYLCKQVNFYGIEDTYEDLYMVYSDQGLYPLSYKSSSGVGYGFVTEFFTDEQGVSNGKVEYSFSNISNIPNAVGTAVSWPFVPNDLNTWKLGLLKKKNTYKYTDTYQIVKKEEFSFIEEEEEVSSGRVYDFLRESSTKYQGSPIFANYAISTGSSLLSKKTIVEKNEIGEIKIIENIEYSPISLLPIKKSITNSDGIKIIDYVLFPNSGNSPRFNDENLKSPCEIGLFNSKTEISSGAQR